eukprot:jgi/Orpsp1_1/1179669/evm.model.c7180000070274.1
MDNSTKGITFNRLPILGGDQISFEEWKFTFERWCGTNKVTEEEQKIEYLFSLTTNIARTIVFNSLNKTTPDNYDTILTNLKKHYKHITSKNTRLLELSTITIKKDENISEFDVRFDTLLNQLKLEVGESVITSYYINAFRNWDKIYESLLEGEPSTLEKAREITSKKGKILKIIEENKPKTKNHIKKNNDNYNTTNNELKTNRNYKNYNNNNRNDYVPPFNIRTNKYNNDNNNNIYKNNNYNNNYNNYNKYNNNNSSTRYNMQTREEVNKRIEQRRNTLRPPKPTTDELDDITQKLEKLKINFCIQCQ